MNLALSYFISMSKVKKASPAPKLAKPKPKAVGMRRRTAVARGYTRSDPADAAVQAAWTTTTPSTSVVSGMGVVRVSRTELFDYIITDGEGAYGASWSVNPANNVLFPWLSAMAPLFEQFEFKRLRVGYIPSSNYIATGAVALAFKYDVLDTPNVTFADVSMYQGAVTGSIRTPCSTDIVKSRCQLQRYYLLNNGAYTIDRTTCPAWFTVAIHGGPQTSPLGRLSVTYDVEFSSAQNPERPLTLCSAYANITTQIPIPYQVEGEPFTALPWALVIPTGNVPNWCGVSDLNTINIRNNVDEVNVFFAMFGTTLTHPYSRAWAGVSYMSNHACLVNIDGGANGALVPRANNFYCGCTDQVSSPGNSHQLYCYADLKRPAGTAGDWSFRFLLYPATSVTYTSGGDMNLFTGALLEITQAIN